MIEIAQEQEIKMPTDFNSLSSFIDYAYAQPMLEEDEEKQLLQTLALNPEDQYAFTKIFNSFLRLVIAHAKKNMGYGSQLEDLIQEGCIGLIKAIRKFDISFNVRFSSYAVHWVSSEIREYCLKNFSIVKTITTKDDRKLFFNLNRIKAQYAQDEGQYASLKSKQIKEIAKELNLSEEKVREVELKLAADLGTKHLKSRIVTDGDSDDTIDMLDVIEDRSLAPDVICEQAEEEYLYSHILQAAFSKLNEREQKIIRSRWMNDDKITLSDLSVELGVSTERVRQLESKAMKTLKTQLSSYNPFN